VRSRLAAARFQDGIVALDYFGDTDLRALETRHPIIVRSLPRDFQRSRTLAGLVGSAGALAWRSLIYSGGLENRPGLLRRLERQGSILGNDASVVRPLRNPERFFRFLRRQGIPHPPTVAGESGGAAGQETRCLWKPLRSGGGSRIRRARRGDVRRRGFYMQRQVDGTPGSAVFVADGTRAVLLGVSEQLCGIAELGGAEFRYCGNIAGPAERLLSRRALGTLAEAVDLIARRFALRGLGGLDFVLAEGVPRVLEVNPRYTASMELFEELSGVNLIDVHLEALEPGRLPAGLLSAGRFLAKGIVYAQRSCVWRSPAAAVVRDLRDRPAEEETIDSGGPICTLVVPGATPSECRQLLFEEAERLRTELRKVQRRPRRSAPLAAPRSMLR
jgi:uncharacterized protein